MTRRILAPLTLALVLATGITNPGPTPPVAGAAGPGSNRLTVFISDLHLGVGRLGGGAWSPFEDFRWEREFSLFLERLNREGGGRTDLVLNGDTFELWQSLEADCRYSNRDLGCTESEAMRRLSRVLAQHAAELRGLAAFAASGDNTVAIVPGNHDAAVLFPAVARAVLAAMPAPSGRVRVLPAGYWLSADRLVYAEHGHQIGEEVNRFEGWPEPFLSGPRGRHLRRPWGEQFVQSYYNEFEAKYPIIDNISDERAAMRYAMAAEGRLGSAVASAEFLRFFLLRVSNQQLGQALGETGGPPTWDLARIRAQGDAFLVESFPDGDPLKAEVARAAGAGRLPLGVEKLGDADIRAICDHRALLVERNLVAPDPRVRVTRCPATGEGLGATAQYLLASRDEMFSSYLKQTAKALGQSDRPFAIFVYSHTHVVDEGFYPLRRQQAGWDPHVVNTGAWQRVVSPETLARENRPPAEALRRTVESLPPCYSMIWIAPYDSAPVATIRSWQQKADSSWDFGPRCEG